MAEFSTASSTFRRSRWSKDQRTSGSSSLTVPTTSINSAILSWGHPALLQALMLPGSTRFTNGTFRCVLGSFKQRIILMTHDHASDLFIPVLFVLATFKTQDTYWKILNFVIVSTTEKMRSATVICAFEAALIEAVGVQFSEANRVDCYFHWKQALSRRMRALATLPSPSVPKSNLPFYLATWISSRWSTGATSSVQASAMSDVELQRSAELVRSSTRHSVGGNPGHTSVKFGSFAFLLKSGTWELVERTNNVLERINRETNAAFASPHLKTVDFVSTVKRMSRAIVERSDSIRSSRARRPTRHQLHLPSSIEFNDDDDGTGKSDDAEKDGDDRASTEGSGDEAMDLGGELLALIHNH
ncbi:hypothetical protein PybrP1_010183 [[Pythium] brassicae (nom. inval.)]|nr:hypothetical protein PybrP1_010183 [[Pythium] brassicae (nom. inval.)]